MTDDVDVLVAGAGPVGLMLACELALAGVSALVVERRHEIDPTIKAGSLNTPSVEALYRRGLLDELREAQERNLEQFAAFMRQRAAGDGAAGGPPRTPPRFAGHFAGVMLRADLLDGDDPDLNGHGPADMIGLVNQQQLEEILAGWAGRLGVRVRRGAELTGFAEDDTGVTVTVRDGGADGPGESVIRCRWLAGCDGGRSMVRKLAGFDFPGTDPEITAYQALAEVTGTEALGVGWHATPTGVYAHGPVPGRILTVQFTGPRAERDAPVTPEELEASIRHVTGAEVTVAGIKAATRFTDNARQATTYRLGRVLLAGDAAHVHSPFGGQGLNLGLGDAVNLGWKLAATVRGQAPDGLLDTYTAERHPIGAWVLDWTRAQVSVMRPDPRARAMRQVVQDLAGTVTGTTYFAKRISGVWQRYAIPGDHPLVGASAPDLGLADGSTLAGHLREGRAVLFDLAGDLAPVAAGHRDRVTVVAVACPERPELAGLLVRPDGFVAWAGDAGAAGTGALERALTTWFGAPVAALA
ncbi:FAD-dependent oxidoreductase [Sphaerisporangium siamense]|uniref:2-polyprenyl-6-methoxyphenol hydroxylase-like FAD-dependent oxidoreductase n=1 Tax=Sphaerisporangium siamense TaxID=795645 RepID=A0A7W7D7S5_9ACTN|nr:FAD-dependent monooxygenase [Sphaerisporangium siamense]MBB4700443.1 2-polyprenyl-6-methoxyphenol hydroxylase-like FAD-dependent oxidoreductase [Sphaerisporangium siamense]GII88394.1 FAD-dependent oxidoreductase [Sphaerisporangium siamense]